MTPRNGIASRTRITQIQQDELCVRRAVWLMALLAALAMAGLGYAAVFMAEYPLNVPQFTTRLAIKALCVLGATSLFCLFGFLILGVMFRKELDQRREDCRRLALKVLESRLGQPCTTPPLLGRAKESDAPAIGLTSRPEKPADRFWREPDRGISPAG